MKLRFRTVAVLPLAFILTQIVSAQQNPMAKNPFTADMEFASKKGRNADENIKGTIAVGRQHMRMQIDQGGPMGGPVTVINNFASQTSDILMPTQHMYMEMKADQNAMARHRSMLPDIKPWDANNPCGHEQGWTCKDMGTETVNGRTTEHWRVTDKEGKTSDAWIDKALMFPIKSVSEDQTWTLTNIKEGEPAASLFEIPRGYQKMDMGQMMRGAHPQE